jgi:hypothetical protein
MMTDKFRFLLGCQANCYTKIYMICKIFKIDLLDFQGFNLRNFRKPILFEYKTLPIVFEG